MIDKKAIVERAYAIAGDRASTDRSRGTCFYLADAVVRAAREHGHRLIIQAGTAYWPRVTDETDDGEEPNQFGYCWESTFEDGLAYVAKHGTLPEMHVWAADPAAQEIVDLSIGQLPSLCEALAGLPWKAPEPPRWVWQPFGDFPDLTSYVPTMEATALALFILKRKNLG